MPNLRSLILACLIGVALPVQTPAQSTFATITGTATDPSGAAVPNATVEATNVNTGYVYTATSNEEGIYTLNNLLDGTYSLKASAAGFGEFAADNIVLAVRENRRVDIEFQVGTVSSTVDVTASGATLIEHLWVLFEPSHSTGLPLHSDEQKWNRQQNHSGQQSGEMSSSAVER